MRGRVVVVAVVVGAVGGGAAADGPAAVAAPIAAAVAPARGPVGGGAGVTRLLLRRGRRGEPVDARAAAARVVHAHSEEEAEKREG